MSQNKQRTTHHPPCPYDRTAQRISRRDFLQQLGGGTLVWIGTGMLPCLAAQASAASPGLKKGLITRKLSPYFTPIGDNTIRCDLCPHRCEVSAGQRGFCEVRENIDGRYYSLVYANPCAVHVDPIEKKPFFHVLPASRSFSIATAGCNFDCKFCQNWEISQARPENTFNYDLPPTAVIRLARQYHCQSIASTYVEPTIFIEYMLDIARQADSTGLLKVIHSNGFINRKPLNDLCRHLDAACIDLKGFSETYYRNMTGGSLKPVLNTLVHLKTRRIHTEIVTLIIPGKNDDPDDLKAMCRWIRNELGSETPLHFSRFYPQYKLRGIHPTPVGTLENARRIAMDEGLVFVYIGNVANHPAEHTYCPRCRNVLIKRIGYQVDAAGIDNGRCRFCGRQIPGIWRV